MKTLRVLVIGDVVGKPGRKACAALIPRFRKEEKVDFVIANIENSASGSGITESTVEEMFRDGVNVMTSGDHIFRKKDAITILQQNHCVLRPANYPRATPGVGCHVVEIAGGIKIGIINLIGRVFMKPVNCPFETADAEIEKIRTQTKIILVDIHAEATSEKIAMGWYLDGRVSAIFGTHTHIQTADEQILSQGTGYITDVGMCGPYHSVIGRKIENALELFLTQIPVPLEVASEDVRLAGIIFDIDTETGKTVNVRRIQEKIEIGAA